ncbi:MAG: gephyrin-like molybdotransferase Glp [Anaerolineaceae bacterium]|nr:gephyrin-like molybdotransferase Glp [Anaerolineaceae bacterium]
MPEFLKLANADEARQLLYDAMQGAALKTELVPSAQAAGRYLTEEIVSEEFLPPFTRSSMDGYAVQAKDTRGASESLPIYLKIIGEVPMGAEPQFILASGQAALIHTGGMLPEGADAVVILELSQKTPANELEVYKAVAPGENVIFKGEDVKPGQTVLTAGRRIRPAEIGGLLALGKMEVRVAARPHIALLSSGDEVIPPKQIPQIGQVRDVNSGMLAALIESEGGIAVSYPILPDNWEQISTVVRQAYQENDAVVISAGSSASTRDMTAEAIHQLGEPGVLVHGINIRPGKPTILAYCDGKPVIGLPGNPVSAMVIAHFFVRPVVRWMQGGIQVLATPTLKARLEMNYASQSGRDEWIPVQIERTGSDFIARPVFFKSNLIFQLAGADGLVYIPRDANGLEAGTQVEVVVL